MQREIVATRRAGVPTSIVRDVPIASKGEQLFHHDAWMYLTKLEK
jgi:hypothetical protein